MARSHCAPVTEGDGEQVCFAKIHIWFNKMSAVDQHVLLFVHTSVLFVFSVLMSVCAAVCVQHDCSVCFTEISVSSMLVVAEVL